MERLRITQVWPIALAFSAGFAGCAGTSPGLVSGPLASESRFADSRNRAQAANTGDESSNDADSDGAQ